MLKILMAHYDDQTQAATALAAHHEITGVFGMSDKWEGESGWAGDRVFCRSGSDAHIIVQELPETLTNGVIVEDWSEATVIRLFYVRSEEEFRKALKGNSNIELV